MLLLKKKEISYREECVYRIIIKTIEARVRGGENTTIVAKHLPHYYCSSALHPGSWNLRLATITAPPPLGTHKTGVYKLPVSQE